MSDNSWVSFCALRIFAGPLGPTRRNIRKQVVLEIRIFQASGFVRGADGRVYFMVFVKGGAIEGFVIVAVAILTSRPTSRRAFPHSTLLFTSTEAKVPMARRSLASEAWVKILATLGGGRQCPP